MTKNRYPWEDWFEAKEFVLTRPNDFTCAPQSMVAQLRDQAHRRGVYVSINTVDNALLCKVTNGRKAVGKEQVNGGPTKYPWARWLSKKHEYTLTQGVDYSCRTDTFVQQFRNVAHKQGIKVSLRMSRGNLGNCVRVLVHQKGK